jgi:hypothetical protein
MKPSSICPLAVVACLLSAQSSQAEDADIPSACRASIESRIPGWHLSLPPADLAAYATQTKMKTNILQADLDGDGLRDTAVLLMARQTGRRNQYIAVCLERKGQPELHLIREPYCGDGISVARKGQVVYDYRTGKNVTYRTNGVHAYCLEKAGGTYLYIGGRFVLVVDSD